MKTARRQTDVFSLSFLDVISCGFGAIILLLVLTLALEPATLSRITASLADQAAAVEDSRAALVEVTQGLNQELAGKRESLDKIRSELQRLQSEWEAIQQADAASRADAENRSRVEKELQAVLQSLSEEMKRLMSQPKYEPPASSATIGGIPVDSEYIIFVVDTSGSMLKLAWPTVIKKVREVLEVHPRVKGIQVVNDMGKHMFDAYAGEWIPDTPARRKEIMRRLRSWRSFSNSSPVEGVTYAVKRYFAPDKRISVYVFGDDFSRGSINAVLTEILRTNRKDATGRSRVRIHAFGFPVLFTVDRARSNRERFANLMRVLAEQNDGSFVGLTVLE